MPLRCAELPWNDRKDAPEVQARARTVNALHALMHAIVDYAGLFPPAGLDMAEAVHEYARYGGSDDAWMLGRFVVPIARLEEFRAARAAVSNDGRWRLSALLGADVARDVDRAAEFNARLDTSATIDCLEARITAPDDVASLAGLPIGAFSVFGELPVGAASGPIVSALRDAGFNAKLRTGGITPDSIPDASWLIRAIRACIDAGVPFKATAGLHHPIRGRYRLTYAEHAPTGIMYGYLNLFLAAAFLARGLAEHDATELLTEQDPRAFVLLADSVRWRGHTLAAADIRIMRDRVATSFGSCSFREPVDELRELATVS
jgi:hypothetical protein